MKEICLLITVLIIVLNADLVAQHHQSSYAGEQSRAIASLSNDDIKALKNGEGWGLAKPAELNGYPGPLHVLELADQLELSDRQVEQTQALYEQMKVNAIEAGLTYIKKERKLDQAFTEAGLDQEQMNELLTESSHAYARLRAVHLKAHLEMMSILSTEQVQAYNVLRGYGDDPCANVPAGHDAEMWKKHNGCNNN